MPDFKHFFYHFYRLLFLYLKSKEKFIAFCLVAASLFLTFFIVRIHVWINQWNNEFYTILQTYNESALGASLLHFSYLAFFLIILSVIRFYAKRVLYIRWRQWLTSYYVNKWLSHKAYYLLHLKQKNLDNPDQRIAEDVNSFVSKTLDLFFSFYDAILTLVFFIGILWNLSQPLLFSVAGHSITLKGYLVWCTLGYAALGTLMTRWMMQPVVPLDIENEKREGDFRYALVRLRENSESVAFYGEEDKEQLTLQVRFQALVKNLYQIMFKFLGINLWLSGYGQLCLIVPFLLLMPAYFAKTIALGGLMQTVSAFGTVQDSFSVLINSYPTIVAWKASTLRLLTFEQNIEAIKTEKANSHIHKQRAPQNDINVSKLTLYLPNQQILTPGLTQTFIPHESVLIQGPSGCGKSTFLKAINGLWPWGKGVITVPDTSILFLPQKPYIPLGTLGDILRYGSSARIAEREIKDILALVSLEHLVNQLDIVQPWSYILSLGEQQRLSMGRVLLHQPAWVFLDEATSALDEKNEAAMYTLFQERCPGMTWISVGHRSSLHPFHSRIWDFPITPHKGDKV